VVFVRLCLFFMNFHNTHDIDIRVFKRLLNIGKFRVLNLEQKIHLGCHAYTS
jgi:hypothetical protein